MYTIRIQFDVVKAEDGAITSYMESWFQGFRIHPRTFERELITGIKPTVLDDYSVDSAFKALHEDKRVFKVTVYELNVIPSIADYDRPSQVKSAR